MAEDNSDSDSDMQNATNDSSRPPQLDAVQARVLGCLIEKEATTPDVYPLTVNAAHAAANQKTARDPVMQLDPGEVQHALRELEQLGLAAQHFSSRAERYAHRAAQALDLTTQQVALLGLLLLRGAQTTNELLARSERIAKFEDAREVRHHLERLAQRDVPLVARLQRGSGQREERYAHLLGGPMQADTAADAHALTAAPPAQAAMAPIDARLRGLELAIEALQQRIARLENAAGD